MSYHDNAMSKPLSQQNRVTEHGLQSLIHLVWNPYSASYKLCERGQSLYASRAQFTHLLNERTILVPTGGVDVRINSIVTKYQA
jgi:hypothetical protein